MPRIHDPYLVTVRRSLNEERIKSRKKNIQKTSSVPKSFLSKNITLSDYVYLPEELQKLFLGLIFIFIPYILGLIILSIIMGAEKFKELTTFNFDLFMFTWTIGYESIALILLTLIIKSAFTCRKK